MIRITNLRLAYDHTEKQLRTAVLGALGISAAELISWKIKRRSLDARRRKPLRKVYTIIAQAADEHSLRSRIAEESNLSFWTESTYQAVSEIWPPHVERPIVVGTGPAGLFAGLILAEAGCKPLLIERGKPVEKRKVDVRNFWKEGILNEESNVQFGEGGAGTFSDGKLGSRIKDKYGRREKVLQELVDAGAPEEILFDSKPHVGTANLVQIVKNLRYKIENLGGEYRFAARVVDLVRMENQLRGVSLADGEEIFSPHVILAIGHSARDTFEMLVGHGVVLSPKPFSVGFRIEHPQDMIDQNQYGKQAGHPALPVADYQLSCHTSSGRTVYSFCMCPGGTVIGAASELESVVTNGMSQYERSGKNANSAIVAEVYPADFGGEPFGGIQFQRKWESIAYILGGRNYHAPAQLVGDFLVNQRTSSLGRVKPTYLPGIQLTNLRDALPAFLTSAIAEALPIFNRKISGFTLPDAVLTGVETRTSCPLRIVRGKNYQSVSLRGLYPAGEGSGYAGGIMSSAVDGIKAAEKVLEAAQL